MISDLYCLITQLQRPKITSIFRKIQSLSSVQDKTTSQMIIRTFALFELQFFVKHLDMQTAKPSISYRFNHYDIELTVYGERKLSMTVVDTIARVQYYDKEILLETIGVNTLNKAFERSKQEIKVDFAKKAMAENDLLELKVTVESPFLKPVEEVILLKKLREVSEEQTVKKALDHLSKRVKELKENNQKNKITTYVGATLEQKSYNGANYEPIASIKLPKGKYLLTINFLLKAQNQWLYLYFNQGQALMQNAGFYAPTSSNFIPITFRKIHEVTAETQNVSFCTYCANSYPVTIRNAIVTAKPMARQ